MLKEQHYKSTVEIIQKLPNSAFQAYFFLFQNWGKIHMGFPHGTSGKENLPANSGDRLGFKPWVGKIPWRRAWQPIPVPLPGESHVQKNLVSYVPKGSQRVRRD